LRVRVVISEEDGTTSGTEATRGLSLRGSQPVYRKRVDKNVFATMRDGTRLAVDVYRPDAPGRFPALLSIVPDVTALKALATRLVLAGGRESRDHCPYRVEFPPKLQLEFRSL
jgi:predicted acyl esterase